MTTRGSNSITSISLTILAMAMGGNGLAQSLSITPSAPNCGSVQIGTTMDTTITLTNAGGAGTSITVTQLTTTGTAFSIQALATPTPFTLPVGQSTTATVRFAPSSTTSYSGGLQVNYSESATSGSPVTATYQNGQNGYTGGKAVDISTLSAAAYNDFNGTTFNDDVDWCVGDLPGMGYNIAPLIRFEDLGIPTGSVVSSASLYCVFITWNSGQKVIGHYLKVPWTTSFGSGGSGVGWLRRDTGLPWNTAGARGDGTDVHSGKSFSYGPFGGIGRETGSANLDATIVQGWVDNPSSNYGIVMTVDLSDHHTDIRQPQNSVTADRPVLSITYQAYSAPAAFQNYASLQGTGIPAVAVEMSRFSAD